MDDKTRTVVVSAPEALRFRRYAITVERPGEPDEICAFSQRRVSIGADLSNDIVVARRGVSRHHAELVVDAVGHRLRDLSSKNGTFVQGVRVFDAIVVPGQRILLGDTVLRVQQEDEEFEVPVSRRERFGNLLGQSPVMREVFGLLERAASTDVTVLVQGSSGTGKELVARALHDHSARHTGPFVVFDCSAVARDLIESELFGHVRGAFTGAATARVGAFEAAQGGTLFLDELGELSLDLQPKLLRALEQREIRRVGSNEVVPVNVRIIAATHRDLRASVRAGTFREDLFFRLAVVMVRLPDLRERREDIPQLVEQFLQEIRRRTNQPALNIAYTTMQKLQAHEWPGNVRELRNAVERAVALSAPGGDVETRFLQLPDPAVAAQASVAGAAAREDALPSAVPETALSDDASAQQVGALPFKEAKAEWVDRFERAYWVALLRAHAGNISAAARQAGVHRKTAEYILRKLELARGDIGTDEDAAGGPDAADDL